MTFTVGAAFGREPLAALPFAAEGRSYTVALKR
jgi:hypothetical protein